MRIAIQSASPAVVRTLESIVTASGHSLARLATEADLCLCDALHPLTNRPTCPTFSLVPARTDNMGEHQLTCPVSPHALIQKLTHWQQTRLVALDHGWQLDMLARQLTHPDGATLALTEKESVLLGQLAAAGTKNIPRDDLLEAVWGVTDIDTHTLETHIYRLRSKLEGLFPSPGDIVTDAGSYHLALTA